MEQVKFILSEKDMPRKWYNLQADLPNPMPPYINPGTGKPVEPDDLLVGNVGKHFRGCNIWAEYSGLTWLVEELDSGIFDKKAISDSLMLLEEEERNYLRSVEGFWQENGLFHGDASCLKVGL